MSYFMSRVEVWICIKDIERESLKSDVIFRIKYDFHRLLKSKKIVIEKRDMIK